MEETSSLVKDSKTINDVKIHKNMERIYGLLNKLKNRQNQPIEKVETNENVKEQNSLIHTASSINNIDQHQEFNVSTVLCDKSTCHISIGLLLGGNSENDTHEKNTDNNYESKSNTDKEIDLSSNNVTSENSSTIKETDVTLQKDSNNTKYSESNAGDDLQISNETIEKTISISETISISNDDKVENIRLSENHNEETKHIESINTADQSVLSDLHHHEDPYTQNYDTTNGDITENIFANHYTHSDVCNILGDSEVIDDVFNHDNHSEKGDESDYMLIHNNATESSEQVDGFTIYSKDDIVDNNNHYGINNENMIESVNIPENVENVKKPILQNNSENDHKITSFNNDDNQLSIEELLEYESILNGSGFFMNQLEEPFGFDENDGVPGTQGPVPTHATAIELVPETVTERPRKRGRPKKIQTQGNDVPTKKKTKLTRKYLSRNSQQLEVLSRNSEQLYAIYKSAQNIHGGKNSNRIMYAECKEYNTLELTSGFRSQEGITYRISKCFPTCTTCLTYAYDFTNQRELRDKKCLVIACCETLENEEENA